MERQKYFASKLKLGQLKPIENWLNFVPLAKQFGRQVALLTSPTT